MATQRRGPGKTHKPEDGEIDIGLGSLFKGLGDLVNVLGNLAEAGERQASRSGEFKVKGLDDKVRGVYGVSVRVGIGGGPQVQRFGNIRSTAQGPEVVDVREPLIDVFDEGDQIVVAAELPGAGNDAIEIEVRGDILAITASGPRRYAKEVLLPSPVDPTSLERSFKNGLLELRLKKNHAERD